MAWYHEAQSTNSSEQIYRNIKYKQKNCNNF